MIKTSSNWFVLQSKPVHARLKPAFHMSGKSQTIEDLTFCQPSQILPIYWIIARLLSQTFHIINSAGNGKFVKFKLEFEHKCKQHLQQYGCARADATSFSIHVFLHSSTKVFHYEKQKPPKWKAKRFWIKGYFWNMVRHTVFGGAPLRQITLTIYHECRTHFI